MEVRAKQMNFLPFLIFSLFLDDNDEEEEIKVAEGGGKRSRQLKVLAQGDAGGLITHFHRQ